MVSLIDRLINKIKGDRNNPPKNRQVLCYHSVSPSPYFHSKFHWVSTEDFLERIERLQKSGFTFLPIDEYLQVHRKYKKVVSITFDDGYKDVVDFAIPVLKEMEIPATIFLCSNIVEGKAFWRDKVRYIIDNGLINDFRLFSSQNKPELVKSIDWTDFYKSSKQPNVHSGKLDSIIDRFFIDRKITLSLELYLNKTDLAKLPNYIAVGNHTSNHFMLSSLNKEEQFNEIEEGHRFIRSLSTNLSNVFCIPFGDYHTFDQNTLDLLNYMGYDGFVMTNEYNLSSSVEKQGLKPYNLFYSNRILPKS